MEPERVTQPRGPHSARGFDVPDLYLLFF